MTLTPAMLTMMVMMVSFVCAETASGDMVACDGPDCPNEWFHFICVGLTEEPEGVWFCTQCNACT